MLGEARRVSVVHSGDTSTPSPDFRFNRWGASLLLLIVVSGLASAGDSVRVDDIAWLRKNSYDLSPTEMARLQSMGREGLLEAQLTDRIDESLPPAINSVLAGFIAYSALSNPMASLFLTRSQEQARINSTVDVGDKAAFNRVFQDTVRKFGDQAQKIVVLRAIYGPNQLKEQLVGFWLNHFSVFLYKGQIRLMAADYAEHVIRPHALGTFKDLVMATLKSPAMLENLDNARNTKGKVNENYARELMELHTLGVGAGYSQLDVQQLALILTGAGFIPFDGRAEVIPPALAPLLIREDLFEFNPTRHDFSDKLFLGQAIKGSGFAEIEQAVDLIVRQPACAVFISRKLAEYFVADYPPEALVQRMAATFQRSDGDISEVMRTLFQSPELMQSRGSKFKDPLQFVVSSVRLAYDKPLLNVTPVLAWLNALGQPVFGRSTPDGWPTSSSAWTSSGQMSKRFEIARTIGRGDNALFMPEGDVKPGGGFPMISSRLFYDAVSPRLSASTHDALDQAASQQEWNTYVLSSPEFNYR